MANGASDTVVCFALFLNTLEDHMAVVSPDTLRMKVRDYRFVRYGWGKGGFFLPLIWFPMKVRKRRLLSVFPALVSPTHPPTHLLGSCD